MELKVRDVYLDGRKLEPGQPLRCSKAAQENVARIAIQILQRIEAEKARDREPN
jgi:hypothetical protein